VDKNTVLDIVSRFRNALEAKNIRINQLILYGSYANGTYKEGSDIDLIVISKDFKGKGYWKRIDILSDAIYEVFEPIEAIAMTPDEWKNKKMRIVDYASEGEVVFAA
jgi:uncharacterized protein